MLAEQMSEKEQKPPPCLDPEKCPRVAACLDLLVARCQVKVRQIEDGKQILARIVPLLLGLRGYLNEQTDEG